MDLTESEQEKARVMLAIDEGVRGRPYDDGTNATIKAPVGNVTIGVGHNTDAKPLTEKQITLILDDDISDARAAAQAVVGLEIWARLSENRRLALINLAFSLGAGGLANFKAMLRALRLDNYRAVGAELRHSLWVDQVDPRRRPGAGRDDRVLALLEDDRWEYDAGLDRGLPVKPA